MKTFLSELQLVPTARQLSWAIPKEKDGNGGQREAITLSLHKTDCSPAPGTLITSARGRSFLKGVSKYFPSFLFPFLQISIFPNLIECDRQATGLLGSFEQWRTVKQMPQPLLVAVVQLPNNFIYFNRSNLRACVFDQLMDQKGLRKHMYCIQLGGLENTHFCLLGASSPGPPPPSQSSY